MISRRFPLSFTQIFAKYQRNSAGSSARISEKIYVYFNHEDSNSRF
jgi:hypothetical protein